MIEEKSIFDTVIGTLKRSLDEDLEAKINKICELQIQQDSIIIRRNDDEISVQGSLSAIIELDTRLKEALKTSKLSSFCTSKALTDQEFTELQATNVEKIKNREDRLPILHCHHCSFETKRPNHLQKHVQKHSKITAIVSCNDCDFKCLRECDLAKHKLRNHNQEKPKKLSKNSMKKKEINLLECSICNYKTFKSSMMTRHFSKHQAKKKNHQEKTQKMMLSKQPDFLKQCSICEYSTFKTSNLARHKRIHSDERKHKCLTCGLSFKRSDTLTNHLATHGTGLKFCDICAKVCRSQNHLNDHKATHSDERNFLCHICGMTFKTKATKNMHLRNVHEKSQLQKTLDLNQVDEEDVDHEPVIYTLDLAPDDAGLENNLQYLINDSGSFIISSASEI